MNYRVAIMAFALAFAGSNTYADTYVEGYTKSDGTYVAPHYRSSPNGTKYDNWSTEGNTNPRTYKRGTKKVCGAGKGYYC